MRYRQLFEPLSPDEIRDKFRYVAEGGLNAGKKRMMSSLEFSGEKPLSADSVPFMSDNLTSPGFSEGTTVEFEFLGRRYYPGEEEVKQCIEGTMTRRRQAGTAEAEIV